MWTTTLPDESGYYWMRIKGSKFPCVINVNRGRTRDIDQMFVEDGHEDIPIDRYLSDRQHADGSYVFEFFYIEPPE